ncbi:hypothetical protein [Azospirillum endophyticum]
MRYATHNIQQGLASTTGAVNVIVDVDRVGRLGNDVDRTSPSLMAILLDHAHMDGQTIP